MTAESDTLGGMKLPTGHQLKAARALVGLEQRQVAKLAKVNPVTLHRMEACAERPVRGHAGNVESVVNVLRDSGVEITEDGV